MIGRREALMALLGAPVAGKAAIAKAAGIATQAAAVGGGLGPMDPPDAVTCDNGRSGAGQNAINYLHRIREAQWRREKLGEQAVTGRLPPHISGRRSWSAVYKAHVAEGEFDLGDIFGHDDNALLMIARELGFRG